MPGALYPWLKAIHVAAAFLFFGGVMAVSVFLWSAPSAANAAARLRRWDHAVTTPAMLLAWTCGLLLVLTGQWQLAVWLVVKLVLVVLLSALHGVQSGRLRRVALGHDVLPWPAPPVAVILICGIALLAVLKPS